MSENAILTLGGLVLAEGFVFLGAMFKLYGDFRAMRADVTWLKEHAIQRRASDHEQY